MPIELIAINDERPLPGWHIIEYRIRPARYERGSVSLGMLAWYEPESRHLILRMNSAAECAEYEFAWGAGALVIEYEMPGRVRRVGLFVCVGLTGVGDLQLLEIERVSAGGG